MPDCCICAERQRLEEELEVTDSLLNERQRVLDAIPECPSHGPCVPHALEWIAEVKELEAKLAITERALLFAGIFLADSGECPLEKIKGISWGGVPGCNFSQTTDFCHKDVEECWRKYCKAKVAEEQKAS